MAHRKSWDVFCHVVDNYGDIGVCWRLARQLAAEHGLRVRLWVDDLLAFRRICPEIDPGRPIQRHRGVEVCRWVEPFPAVVAADVVVEAFACQLPENYIQAMASCPVKPCWINLEYLSAEEWVGECHGLASPHIRLPLTKHFFFPGFTENTGGVLLERNLFARRQAFRFDARAQEAFWQQLGLPLPHGEETRVSLFCYPGSRAEELFECWRKLSVHTVCLVPEGIAGEAIAAFFGQSATPQAGVVLCRGGLEVRVIPFLEQDDFDKLLWACDCNFVRGEDSFVRAQWAMRPMVWQPYPQAEGAHLHKLQAFLERYCKNLSETAAETVKAMWGAWSRGRGMAEAWPGFWAQKGVLTKHAESWATALGTNGDLATKLVKFCSNKL
jgi:uncharacterized repeat protein (TIGR03837 family)